MESSQLQQILFYAGIALVTIGVLLAIGAFYMFRKFDILDIHDDLSGKKRAEGVAKMMAEQASGKNAGKDAKARRSQKTLAAGQTTGHLSGGGTGSMDTSTGGGLKQPEPEAAQPVAQARQAASAAAPATAAPVREVAAPIPQLDEEAEYTTVMAGNNEATTILDDADATTQYAPIQADEPQVEDVPEEPALIEEVPVEEPTAETPESEPAPVEVEKEAAAEAAAAVTTPEVDMTSTEALAAKPAAPEYFHIVRKIVLTESAEYVRVERGDSDE